MSGSEICELLALMVEEVRRIGGHLLVGVLRTDAAQMVRAVEETTAWLAARSGAAAPLDALERAAVCGFTVCPPSGEGLSQEALSDGLAEVLALGLPVALYQLPQVTRNELTASTVADLAGRYPNFFLLKDTSGADRVAASGFRDAFLVRGAEGAYASHLALAGGRYDGFLLSTANNFGRELAELIDRLDRGDGAGAEALSARITAVTEELFPVAGKVGFGNAFANANKALDHFFAHGPEALRVEPPCLRGGRRLPRELVEAAGASLSRHGFMPARGYLGA
jgi:hypothetical protein